MRTLEGMPSSHLSASVIAVVVAAYLFLDSAFFQVLPIQRALYAAILGVALLTLMSGAKFCRLPVRMWLVILCWLALNAIWICLGMSASLWFPGWVIGDAATLLLPLLFFLVGQVDPRWFGERRWLIRLLLLVAMGSGLAAGVSIATGGGRFESPSILLYALPWLGIALAKESDTKLPWIGLLVLVAAMCVWSGERTALLLMLGAGALVGFVRFSTARLLLVLVVLLLAVLTVGRSLFQEAIVEAIAESRFEANLEGELDESLLNRVNEATDAYHAHRASPALKRILGNGHGASFSPSLMSYRTNSTESGLIHHIHVGPILVLFRYGWVGIALVCVGLLLIALRFARLRNQKSIDDQYWLSAYFAVTTVLYVLASMVFNKLPDPGFSYTIAGLLSTGLHRE